MSHFPSGGVSRVVMYTYSVAPTPPPGTYTPTRRTRSHGISTEPTSLTSFGPAGVNTNRRPYPRQHAATVQNSTAPADRFIQAVVFAAHRKTISPQMGPITMKKIDAGVRTNGHERGCKDDEYLTGQTPKRCAAT